MREKTFSIYKILLWTYDRGTWQYDIIVCLILAFVFFIPRTFFNTEKIDKRILAYSQPTTVVPLNPPVKPFVTMDESDGAPAPAAPTDSNASGATRKSPNRERSAERNDKP